MALPLRDGSFNRFDGLIATPHLVATSMFAGRNTVAVWEYGGTTYSRSGELMTHTFTLQRPHLEIGGEYWFYLEEDWLMATPIFTIINASKISGPQSFAVSNAVLCSETNAYGRWLTEAPTMEWHITLMSKFGGSFKLDSKFQANYNTALGRWASEHEKAPSLAPLPPKWSVFSNSWPEFDPNDPSNIKKGEQWGDFFELADITEGTNVPSSTHAMNVGPALSMTYMFDMPPMPGKNAGDEGDLTVAWVDHRKSGSFVDTCLGVLTGEFTKSRTMWNSNSNCPWDGDPTKTFSSFGIWLHEVGHLLGLNHRENCPGKADAVMVGGIDISRSWKLAFLTPDDIARIQKLYPREIAFQGGVKKGC